MQVGKNMFLNSVDKKSTVIKLTHILLGYFLSLIFSAFLIKKACGGA